MIVIEITGQTDRYVIRTIIRLVELLDILQARVLEVLLRTENGVLTIRDIGIQQLVNRQIHFLYIHGGIHVKLLIDGLELRMEAAYDEILEAVGLDHRPARQLSGRDHLVIAGTLIAGEGINTCRTDSTHEFVELIRYRDLGVLIGEGVDEMIDRLALSRIGRCTIKLIERIDGIEVRNLFLVIGSTIRLRTLEHDVLLVVRQTRGLQRIVLSTGTHGDKRLDLRFLFVLTQINGKSVIQCVDTRLQRITFYSTIRILLAGAHQSHCSQKDK